jgi:hypothetical protein
VGGYRQGFGTLRLRERVCVQDVDKRRAAAARHTEGLWGDAATVDETLGRLAEGLAGDWILDELDVAVVESMCAITLARQDLPCQRRSDIYGRVLQLVADWLQGPSEHRRSAYGFLDAAVGDEELPAYIRNSALELLTAQAEECVHYLLARSDQPPAWLPTDEALGPGLTRLLERIEWLELLRSALGLIRVEALGGAWRGRLVRLANLAGMELAAAVEEDQLLAAHSEAYLLLAEMLCEAWLMPAAAARVRPLVTDYVGEVCTTMDLYVGVTVVQRPIYEEAAGLLTLSCLPDDIRSKVKRFLTTHQPTEDTEE